MKEKGTVAKEDGTTKPGTTLPGLADLPPWLLPPTRAKTGLALTPECTTVSRQLTSLELTLYLREREI